MLGDYDSAIKSLQKAIDEKLDKANYYMGEAYQKQGDNDSSQKYFKKYLDSGEADSYEDVYKRQVQAKGRGHKQKSRGLWHEDV